MTRKILVTPRSATSHGHPALERIKAAGYEVVFCTPGEMPTEAELVNLLPGCVGYLAGVEKITATVLEAAAELRVISRNGIGVDSIDLEAAERQGVRVCKAVGANARGVAELTIAFILALARWIPFSDQAIKDGGWQRRKGIELEGKTLGLVGCGKVGRYVAQMALGMGMRVLAFDIAPDTEFRPGGAFSFASFDDVTHQADVLSLHCPPNPAGRHVIDKSVLERMKKGSYLINTARYDLVDVAALAEQLDNNALAGAAFDVFDTEPPTDRSLLDNDRIITTPHIGGFTTESVDRAVGMAVDNLLEALK
jgi:D-3-phosphoglycerate dehydrogenase